MKRTQQKELRKLKSNGWSQQAEILATSVNKSKIFYEVPISYSGRTFEEGKKIPKEYAEYTSHNTTRLTVPQIKDLLLSLDFIKESLDR